MLCLYLSGHSRVQSVPHQARDRIGIFLRSSEWRSVRQGRTVLSQNLENSTVSFESAMFSQKFTQSNYAATIQCSANRVKLGKENKLKLSQQILANCRSQCDEPWMFNEIGDRFAPIVSSLRLYTWNSNSPTDKTIFVHIHSRIRYRLIHLSKTRTPEHAQNEQDMSPLSQSHPADGRHEENNLLTREKNSSKRSGLLMRARALKAEIKTPFRSKISAGIPHAEMQQGNRLACFSREVCSVDPDHMVRIPRQHWQGAGSHVSSTRKACPAIQRPGQRIESKNHQI